MQNTSWKASLHPFPKPALWENDDDVDDDTADITQYNRADLIGYRIVRAIINQDLLNQTANLTFTTPSPTLLPGSNDNDTIVKDLPTKDMIHQIVLLTNATTVGDGVGHWIERSGGGDDVEIGWKKMTIIVLFCLLIVVTVIGNTLVILSVLTTRRLRTVTNCFVMSLAVADWLVGIFVMPPAVVLFVVGSWELGWILCDIWISLDVLLCTASILSLCAISVDRYLAVTQPLNYSKRRRSKRLALFMIFVVWLVALAITCPPILGWYEESRRNSTIVTCHYNQNKGYVVYSAMGSFFLPMIVMLYVYSKICCVLTSRHSSMAKTEAYERSTNDIEADNYTSEIETSSPKRNLSVKSCSMTHYTNYSSSFDREPSHTTLYELVEISSKPSPNTKNSNVICKYTSNNLKPMQHTVQFNQSQLSLPESMITNHKLRIHTHGNRIPIRISSLRRETKTAQTLSMVVGGFIACWLPFFIYYLAMPFIPDESKSEILMDILTWLGWINSAINPFIYAFYNADFRIAFWRLTFRKFCKAKHNLALLKT